MNGSGPTLLFDGVCVLCNGFIKFVLRADSGEKIRFATLQSNAGRKIIADRNVQEAPLSTVVFIDEKGVFIRSSAVLQVLKTLGGAWSIFSIFRFIPTPIRDAIYRLVAHIRYRIFGRYDTCPIPTEEVRKRFLPDGL